MIITVFEDKKSDFLIVPVNGISNELKENFSNVKECNGSLFVPNSNKMFFLQLLKSKCQDENGEVYLITKL